MKLKLIKQSEKFQYLEIKHKGEVLARTACFKAKDGAELMLGRLNSGTDHLRTEIIGVGDLSFEIFDVHGLLLESIEKSIYRNHVARDMKAVLNILDIGTFSVAK